MKKLLCLLLVTFSLMLLTSSLVFGADEIILRFGTVTTGATPMVDARDQLVAQFEDEYPEVEIIIETAPSEDFATKIKMDAASDNMPDVFAYWRPEPMHGMDKFIEAEQIADLGEIKSEVEDIFNDTVWNTATVDGVVRGIPRTNFYMQFLINKKIFDENGLEVPDTFSELMNAITVLKENGYIPWGQSTKMSALLTRPMNYVLNRSLGNERVLRLFTGEESWQQDDVLKAVQRTKEMMVGNLPPDSSAMGPDAITSKYINTERAAMWISGSWATDTIAEEVQENMVPILFPIIEDGYEEEKSVEKDLTNLMYASKDSWNDPDKKQYVKEFIKHMTSVEAAELYLEVGKTPVPHIGTNVDPEVVGELTVEANKLYAEAPGTKWVYAYTDPDNITSSRTIISKLLVGQIEPEEFVKEMDEVWN